MISYVKLEGRSKIYVSDFNTKRILDTVQKLTKVLNFGNQVTLKIDKIPWCLK